METRSPKVTLAKAFNEKSTKKLLLVTAFLELPIGLMLLIYPSTIASILFGATLDTPVSLTIGRVGGVALIALGIVCWITGKEYKNDSSKGLVIAVTFYNSGSFFILILAGLLLGLNGILLWPAIIVHLIMAFWCFLILFNSRNKIQNHD